jgi:hypothetical protein
MDDVQLSELYYALSANVQRVYSKEHLKDVHSPRPQYSNMSEDEIRSIGSVSRSIKGELSYLPASNTEKEAQNIGLLLLVKLLNVF